MGVKLTRAKKRNYWGSFFYFLRRIMPLSTKAKYKLFLNLEWIFYRVSYELSVNMYADKDHPLITLRLEFLKQNINANQSVIDLGCANGFISFLVAGIARKVVGIDHNKQLIEKAKLNYVSDNLQFYNIDATDFLENNDEKYDVLILSHILEHIDNPNFFLLKYINFFEYVYVELPDFDGSILNHFRKDMKLRLIYTDDDHVSEFDRYELKKIFSECGIEVLKEEYIFGIQRYWCRVIHPGSTPKN